MKIAKWAGRITLALLLVVGTVALIGFALPRDHVASRTVVVNRPVADVWRAITDVESFPAWRSGVTRVEVLSTEPRRWREVAGGDTLTLQVVEAQAPTRLVSEIADKDLPFGGRWIYQLKPAGAGTELTIMEEGQVYNPLFRFISRFVIGHTATIDTFLADLQKKLP
jgi:hypothetical protein